MTHPGPAEVNELLGCPFCKIGQRFFSTMYNPKRFRVECGGCGCATRWFATEEETRAAWNRRTLAQPAAAGEALAAEIALGYLEAAGYCTAEEVAHALEVAGNPAHPLHPLPASAGDAWPVLQALREYLADESGDEETGQFYLDRLSDALNRHDAAATGADAKEGG